MVGCAESYTCYAVYRQYFILLLITIPLTMLQAFQAITLINVTRENTSSFLHTPMFPVSTETDAYNQVFTKHIARY